MQVAKYPSEFLSKLTYVDIPGTTWSVGLPLLIDASAVQPPCHIHLVGLPNTLISDGMALALSPEPLSIQVVVDFLTRCDVQETARQLNIKPLQVAWVINNAVSWLCEQARIPIPT